MHDPRFPKRLPGLANVFFLGSVTLIPVAVSRSRAFRARRQIDSTCAARTDVAPTPVADRCDPPLLFDARITAAAMPRSDVTRALARLRPQLPCSVGTVIHALHVFHRDPGLLDEGGRQLEDLKSVLLDQRVAAEWYSGKTSVLATRHGFAYATGPVSPWAGPAAQGHRDQVLCLFAELALPSSTRIFVGEAGATITDFLSEASANFQLCGEIEWSALVQLQWFPGRSSWTNRFGEQFSHDTLACALIARPLHESSCGGAHTLNALAALARSDRLFRTLSDGMRELLTEYLEATAAFLYASQMPEGSFDPDWSYTIRRQAWYRDFVHRARSFASAGMHNMDEPDVAYPAKFRRGRASAGASPLRKLLATGHLVEWAALLDRAQQPGSETITRAARFLCQSLTDATDQQILEHYCPYSHAGAALLLSAVEKECAQHVCPVDPVLSTRSTR